MAFQQLTSFCEFTAASGGAGAFVVGAATAGRLTPAQSNAIDGTTYPYYAQSADGSQWEAGSGPYAVATITLQRTTIKANSNGDLNPVSFATPPIVDVFPPPAKTLSDIDAPYDAESFNNIIVNGGMEVDQRNVGAATIGLYAVDRWVAATSGTMVVSAQQVADAPPGFSNSLKITVSTAEASLAASDWVQIYQPIESYRTSRLQFGTAGALSSTLGFWTKFHRTGLYSGTITGGITRSYPFIFTQNAADTWEYKTVTIPGDITGTWPGNTNAESMRVHFAMASGSTFTGAAGAWIAGNLVGATGTTNGVAATTDTFQITGVSLLPGPVAPTAAQSVLIKRSLDEELRLCRRYYQKSYEYGTAIGTVTQVGATFHYVTGLTSISNSGGHEVRFNVAMRAAPAVATYSTRTGASGKISDDAVAADVTPTIDTISTNGFRWFATTAVAETQVNMTGQWTADAEF